ncbi:unnamed protein product [Effrenium voratum]|uniref:Uncharacterized protein n=1 Tax=Effrenium voratum TaxID=2562239 RepID=A0AA36MTP9_9DINO|nr:unnamed protein product [Effrenium voratum]CAJ1429226.1 unnamed protein product [Effrenium voratum]|mmetsp:Transcript_7925/g.18956  ORF Transcript_7925/g.18956 Transcript_7925/m.18956 type:complete len:178 (-) Transcript_7925:158-691(-)
MPMISGNGSRATSQSSSISDAFWNPYNHMSEASSDIGESLNTVHDGVVNDAPDVVWDLQDVPGSFSQPESGFFGNHHSEKLEEKCPVKEVAEVANDDSQPPLTPCTPGRVFAVAKPVKKGRSWQAPLPPGAVNLPSQEDEGAAGPTGPAGPAGAGPVGPVGPGPVVPGKVKGPSLAP